MLTERDGGRLPGSQIVGMDTYADDFSELIEALELKDTALIGFSAGSGEVARREAVTARNGWSMPP